MKTTTKAKPTDRRYGYDISHDRLNARYDMMHAQSHRIELHARRCARVRICITVRYDNCTIGWDTDNIERLHAR